MKQQQRLTLFIIISLHKHWAISETLRKGCYKIIKDIICPFPELPLRMETLTGIHSLEISHPDDPNGQQVARRGFYLKRNSKKGFWISLWWEKITNVQTNWVPQITNTAGKTQANYLTILQNEASAVKNVLTFYIFHCFFCFVTLRFQIAHQSRKDSEFQKGINLWQLHSLWDACKTFHSEISESSLHHNYSKSLEQIKCTGGHHDEVVKMPSILVRVQSIPLVITHMVP